MIVSKALEVDLPCGVFYNLTDLILDLNGTLAVDGVLIDGVEARLKEICQILDVHVLTADTYGSLESTMETWSEACKVNVRCLQGGRGDLQKLAFLEEIGREHTVAIGNGCNDALMLKEAALGICILGTEGASVDALTASNVVFNNICDALDIFLKPSRMIATLRK